ncbi:MAG: hypothetical protein JXM79_13760 [Sedimentisphaerales bacterium]|nr:hypothetical protein [Sedimentisphaerales bacterium]
MKMFRFSPFFFILILWFTSAASADDDPKVGMHSVIITEAVRLGQPERAQWEVVDDLRVTALYVTLQETSVCLLSYDLCEITRDEVLLLKRAVAEELKIERDCIHIFCTHNHSSSGVGGHDMDYLTARSRQVAALARESAVESPEIDFLRVDTGSKYNINRRTRHGDLGTWCLMQSRDCTDDGDRVDGTEWVRQKMIRYGATPEDVAAIKGPFVADRKNDPFLDLVLFRKADGRYAGGFVRFTAHPVVCSAGYWRRNIGRDYPGVLCDCLSREFDCPILFLQGPCGDHRSRHQDVGLEERDRVAKGLANELIKQRGEAKKFRFQRLKNTVMTVPCAVRPDFPASIQDGQKEVARLRQRLDSLKQDQDSLKKRKEITERMAFYGNAMQVLKGLSYLLPGEAARKSADFEISDVEFGDIHLLNFPGELFSTVCSGLYTTAEGPVVVTSFADGVSGYLLPIDDFKQGGYEWTWALFTPESMTQMRRTALKILRQH